MTPNKHWYILFSILQKVIMHIIICSSEFQISAHMKQKNILKIWHARDNQS